MLEASVVVTIFRFDLRSDLSTNFVEVAIDITSAAAYRANEWGRGSGFRLFSLVSVPFFAFQV